MKCGACGHQHAETSPMVCTLIDCHCGHEEYIPAAEIKQRQSLQYMQQVMAEYSRIRDKVEFILRDIPNTREFSNKQFLFSYWHLAHNFVLGHVLTPETYQELDDPESVLRARRKLVEEHPQYGPADPEAAEKRDLKQAAIKEWCVMEGSN